MTEEIKVGTKILSRYASDWHHGRIGTVKGFDEAGWLYVEFDGEPSYGHTCSGLAKIGLGWFICPGDVGKGKDFEVVEEKKISDNPSKPVFTKRELMDLRDAVDGSVSDELFEKLTALICDN